VTHADLFTLAAMLSLACFLGAIWLNADPDY
jgi:hypothetical protein